MASLNIQFSNPSPILPMRLSAEERKAETLPPEIETARPARPPDTVMTEEERAEYSAKGAELVLVKSRAGTDVEQPRWQANGFSSPQEYTTALHQASLRPQLQAQAPRGTRVLDAWKPATPITTVPAGGKVVLTLSTNKRVVAECASPDDVGLVIQNTDPRQTIRLRSRNTKTGAEEHAAFLTMNGNPCGAVVLNKSHCALIELMPS